METAHKYRVLAWWNSGKCGLVKSGASPSVIHFAAPPQFGGLEGRWSPEDLLLSAVAACFTTTFRALAEHSDFHFVDLELEVEGTVQHGATGYEIAEITIRPMLTLADPDEGPRADRLLQKTKQLCLISRALTVPQKLESRIQVRATSHHREAICTAGRN